jgi:hypothetical protein
VKLLGGKNHSEDEYKSACIYKLKCKDCRKYYVGQTGRTFNAQYKEHTWDIRNNKDNTGYAQHIFNTRYIWEHEGSKANNADNKRRLMDTTEKYHIYKANRGGVKLKSYTRAIKIKYLKEYSHCKITEQHEPDTPTPSPKQIQPQYTRTVVLRWVTDTVIKHRACRTLQSK